MAKTAIRKQQPKPVTLLQWIRRTDKNIHTLSKEIVFLYEQNAQRLDELTDVLKERTKSLNREASLMRAVNMLLRERNRRNGRK